MDIEMQHKHGKMDSVGSPGLTTSFLHPMAVDSPVQSPLQHVVVYNDTSSPQMLYSPTIRKQASSPGLTSPRLGGALFKQNSAPTFKRERSNSIFARERSNSVFKGKSESIMTKLGLQRRKELEVFLQNRGFSSEELDSIVNQFHDIRERLEDGEWVTRKEFRDFFGMREQSLSDHLFDVFKQKHRMHNFEALDFCPSPQMSREKPVTEDGVEADAINLREFLCGLLLLQSNDMDKKLRMVYDLYTPTGSEITKDNLKAMLLVSAKENNITLSDEQFDKLVERIFSKMDCSGTGKIDFDSFKSAFHEFPVEMEQRSRKTSINEFLAMNTASPTSPTKPFSWTINVDDMSDTDNSGIGTQHPDFVEREYEEEDPKRTKRKQKKFENRDKANYIPQQESMPKKKPGANRKLITKLHASGTKYFFISLFFLVNAGLFAWHFKKYGHPEVTDKLGWGVPFARGFAQMLKIDTALLLIPVSRSFLTYLRASPLYRFIPLDKNMYFHKFMAAAIVVGSIGHWAAHLMNFYYISNSSLASLQEINPSYFTKVPSYIALNFMTLPGITGYVMVVSLVIMILFATKRVRKHAFEKFFAAHHIFIIFYAALVLHGAHHILGPYEYWKWFVGPAAIYALERCVRLYKQRRGLKIIEAQILPGRAVMLKMEMPSRKFTYKAGQYIFLNFPTISKFEWHPFTLTSAPHEDFLSCHIRAAGNWTNKVYDLCESIEGTTPDFYVNVDGPYGSASEHVFSYKHAIMIGAGIGVTPYASVLKRMLHRLETEQGTKKVEKVHFFWTCREQGAFQWFADILTQLDSHKDTKDFLEINTFLTGALAQHDIRSIMLWYGLNQEYAESSVDLVTGLSSRTYWGRPNYEKIVEHLFQKYPKERLGVFFCGPHSMAHEVRKHCKTHAALNGSTFHFHKEVF